MTETAQSKCPKCGLVYATPSGIGHAILCRGLNAAEERRHATEPGSASESQKCPACGEKKRTPQGVPCQCLADGSEIVLAGEHVDCPTCDGGGWTSGGRCITCHGTGHASTPPARSDDVGRVRAVTEFRYEMVPADRVCACSKAPECGDDDCQCEDPDMCLAGIAHTAMESRP